MEEEVLVFSDRLFERLGRIHGFCSRVDDYLPAILAPENLSYLRRSKAENDPSYKQLIPYVVLRCGDEVFCYQRGKKGTEHRLHDLYSLGVGGHVCREDGEAGAACYEAGFARELAEEIDIQCGYRQSIVGLVHDDRTPVGAVHVGVVHLFELDEPLVTARDPALAQGRFLSLLDIHARRDQFESWSTFVIDHVLDVAAPANA